MSFTQTKIISENETAIACESGDLAVWGTPAMVAFMENTAIAFVSLPEGKTSVGVKMDLQHLRAALVGDKVTCKAEIKQNAGNKIVFAIEVTAENGELVGLATHERYIVDIERFMSKIR
ncbi:MAG: thioesterase family protein [Prevotellaceae bacterium]|jgi:predicted thioesterase|nr:thioesterase family protein [Prevotellaceae bacterium]